MKRRSFVAIALVAVIALGVWGWRVLFPSPERAVRLRLRALAQSASFEPNEAPFAQVANCQRLANFFSDDILIQVDTGGGQMHTLSSREELFQTALGLRRAVGSLRAEFLDLNIAIGPDKRSADVDLTARIKVAIDRDFIVQELRFTLQKRGREWIIRRVETVKTLAGENTTADKPYLHR